MDSITFGIRRAGVCYVANVAKALRRWRFTHARVDIFIIHSRVAARHGVVFQSDIRARLGIARPTMSVMMKRMERHGLIERRRSEHDRRKIVVALTELGRSAFSGVQARLGEGLLRPFVDTHLMFHDLRTAVPVHRTRFHGYIGVVRELFGDLSQAPYPP